MIPLTPREKRRVLDAFVDIAVTELHDRDPILSDRVLAGLLPLYVDPTVNPNLALLLFHRTAAERSAAGSGCVSPRAAQDAADLAELLISRLVPDVERVAS